LIHAFGNGDRHKPEWSRSLCFSKLMFPDAGYW
jgi:hypothetical protein